MFTCEIKQSVTVIKLKLEKVIHIYASINFLNTSMYIYTSIHICKYTHAQAYIN